MATEIVYLSHNNTVDLILKADGVAVNLAGVTRMTLSIGDTLIDSDNGDNDPITWGKGGYATGEVHISAGGQAITPGEYEEAWLVVYDATNPEGVVWGSFRVEVKAEVET